MPNKHPHDRRDEMPTNPRKRPRFRTDDKITHGVIHMTGVEGNTAGQHARYHTDPKPQGKDWPVVAYTSYVGTDGRRELLLDYEVIGPHAGDMNGKSIGVVAEGNYNERVPTEAVIAGVVQECIYHDAQLGRRLIWTFHNDVMKNRTCPGKLFPKQEVIDRINAHYAQPDPVVDDPKEDVKTKDEKSDKSPSGNTDTKSFILEVLRLVFSFLTWRKSNKNNTNA